MDNHPKYKISNIPVIYEDPWFLIVDKPAGLLTIPTPKKEPRTLTSILRPYRPCHRLDRETSGLLIYAKGKSTQKKMMEVFKQKKVKKKYLAFIRGVPKKLKGEIKNPIEGHYALTQYRIINRKNNFSVAEVIPQTGRTNQIRIHFKQIGHPILGETKYAFRRDFKIKAKRLCLHAKGLEFLHPITKEVIRLDIGLPKDLTEFLERQE